jgi:DNA transposition AAA+ family ATPase
MAALEATQPVVDAEPSASPEWTGTNLAGDIVAAGIAKNQADFRDDLRWWWGYAGDRKLSQAEAARQLGVDPGTYSKVFRGEYKNAGGLVLPPPTKMLSRIRVLRAQERESAELRNKGRVLTPTVMDIHFVCRKAWNDRNIAFIWGDPHLGKSEAVMWFRDDNNHGATLYVDLQGSCGEQEVYRAFARALKISADTPIGKLKPRVFAAIDRTNLVIVDEFHTITFAYQKAGAVRMINALKAIKDRTGCGMVIVSTNVGRDEFDPAKGHDAPLLRQLWRRGVIKLQLPDALRVGDVRAFAEAYHLDFPRAPEKPDDDIWTKLRETHKDHPGYSLCDRIAHDFGIKHLVSVLQDGMTLAKKRGRPLQWKDVVDAQNVYDRLSARKTA